MSDENHQELAALYALGLLEGTERFAFEAQLMARADLRSMVAEFEGTAITLAAAVPQVTPPPSLKASILASVPAPPTPEPVPVPRQAVFRPFLPWAAAAGLAIASVWFGVRSSALQAQNESLASERDLADIARKIAESRLAERTLIAEHMVNDLGARLRRSEDLTRLHVAALASLLQENAEARAIAVWDNDQQRGLLTVEHLPTVAADRDYQIWLIDPQYPIPVDGGVFRPGIDGKATIPFSGGKPIRTVSAFAISLEKKGGVPKAEGPMVLMGRL